LKNIQQKNTSGFDENPEVFFCWFVGLLVCWFVGLFL
jgi:hypothetical protein